MNLRRKRGLSPIVATTLLIFLTVVLAIIIFLWARSFIGENIRKLGSDIERVCERTNFEAEALIENNLRYVYVQNNGDISIYGVEVRTKTLYGEMKRIGLAHQVSINPGESRKILIGGGEFRPGDELLVIPILLGESENNKKMKAYVCSKEYGINVVAK